MKLRPAIVGVVVVFCLLVIMSCFCFEKWPDGYHDYLSARCRIETLRSALVDYHMQQGELPTEEQGLQALVVPVNTSTGGACILESELYDVWGKPYSYALSNGIPVIVSAGADGEFGTADDVDKFSQFKPRGRFSCQRNGT